jgi:D-alanine-D-alanine ligase
MPTTHDNTIRVGVIFGGRSGEHEVSLVSAQSIMNAMDRAKYEIVPIGITREGRWVISEDPMLALQGAVEGAPPALTPPERNDSRELVPGLGRDEIPPLEVMFPVLHGPYGEDGATQGLLELANIPYVGCGVLGSAGGLDKSVTKAILRDAGLPTVSEVVVLRSSWESNPEPIADRIEDELGFPCFIKPANMGSSVGISKAHSRDQLAPCMDQAARYDRKIVVEEAIDAREIECSVLGNEQPIASILGEVVPKREFYDYEAKYADEETELLIPAPLPEALSDDMREIAVRTFVALNCCGLTRVDFFLSKSSGRVYVNEVNTMPGFTSISMYPKLWEATGLSYSDLVDRLIELAIERHHDKQRNETARF